MPQDSPPALHTDIQAHGLIAALPDPWRSYGRLARLDRPAGTFLLLIPGIFGIFLPDFCPLSKRLFYCLLFAIGALLMRSAGCVINDMWDRDIDSRVTRTKSRPLASGALTMRQATGLLIFLLLGGGAILMALPWHCQLLAPVALLLIAFYPLAKRFTWWPQLIMGFTFGFAAPMGYMASLPDVNSSDLLPGLFLYGGVILWQLGFDTIYGFQDIEDDARVGVKSSSRRILSFARPFLVACYSTALALLGGSAWLAGLNPLFLAGFLPAAVLLLGQGWRINPHNAPTCLKAFRFNIIIGLFLSAGFILGRLAG